MSCIDKLSNVGTSVHEYNDVEEWREDYSPGWNLIGVKYPSFTKD